MHLKEKKNFYANEEQILQFHKEAENGIQIRVSVLFSTDKFLDYQKDLINEFLSEMVDKTSNDDYEINEVKSNFESSLQNLNTKLKLFADKVRDVDFFLIKGFAQIIVDNILMTSMIGDTTILIFRNHRLYYSLYNGINDQGKIDLFSDFVEGDIQSGDEILYIGSKIGDIMDNNDFKELEFVLKKEENQLIKIMEEILIPRVDKKSLGFILGYSISGRNIGVEKIKNKSRQIYESGRLNKLKTNFFKDKYQSTVIILSIFIFFMAISLISQFLKSNNETIITSDGTNIGITIDDIKKDLFMFQQVDPTSDEKSMKYHDLLEKISLLESKAKRPDDINQLKQILQNDYYKQFNVNYINSLSKFDDPNSNKKGKLIGFNTIELSKLGNLKTISVGKNINVAGDKSALLGTMNENMRGNLLDYNLQDSEIIKGCNQNLLKDGLYCFTNKGNVLSVNKGGIQTVTTSDDIPFPTDIAGLAVYGKANLYIFQATLSPLGNSTLVTRYRNTLGSQIIYDGGQKYYLGGNNTGAYFGSGFANFAIDGSFLVWGDGKLYQFRRNPPTAFSLDYREIKLLGGDKITNKYGNNVKIISSINSKYVYLFDKDNQTFTVYDSRPAKNNDIAANNYGLYYILRFKFDLGANNIVDVDVPDQNGNKPELYLLAKDGIYKINLFEHIDAQIANKTNTQ